MSPGDLGRQRLYDLNETRLAQLAYRALRRGVSPDDLFIVCIDVDDESWRDLVEELMPGHDWQEYRDRGETPVARGSVTSGIREYLSEVVPDIKNALNGPLPKDAIRVIVMAEGGAAVHLIQPQEDPS